MECSTGALPGSPSGPMALSIAATAGGWRPPAATRASTAWCGSGPWGREASSRFATSPRARTPSSPSPSAPTASGWPPPVPTDHSGLRDRDRQAAGADRGPRRLDLRYRLQPRRQSPRQRQPRQDEQGVRRGEERVARDVHGPRPAGLHRRLQPRRLGCRHRRRRQ